MHKNTKNLKGNKYGSLTVLNLTDLRLSNHRGSVWECKCDCGNICYKTSSDLRDTRRKTLSCGCQNKGKRNFPNKFVPKEEISIEKSILRLSEKHGVLELLTASIMRSHHLSYKDATQIAERLNSSDYLYDRLIDEIVEQERLGH